MFLCQLNSRLLGGSKKAVMLCDEVTSCLSSGWVSLHQVLFVPKGKRGEGNQEKVLSTLYIREDIKLVS